MSETLDFTEKICNDGFILACHVTLSVSGVKYVLWGKNWGKMWGKKNATKRLVVFFMLETAII